MKPSFPVQRHHFSTRIGHESPWKKSHEHLWNEEDALVTWHLRCLSYPTSSFGRSFNASLMVIYWWFTGDLMWFMGKSWFYNCLPFGTREHGFFDSAFMVIFDGMCLGCTVVMWCVFFTVKIMGIWFQDVTGNDEMNYMRVSIVMGVPQARWMVYFMGKSHRSFHGWWLGVPLWRNGNHLFLPLVM